MNSIRNGLIKRWPVLVSILGGLGAWAGMQVSETAPLTAKLLAGISAVAAAVTMYVVLRFLSR